MLQTKAHGCREGIHQRPKGGRFLLQGDADFAELPVRIFCGA